MKLDKSAREKIKNMYGGRCAYCGIVLGEKFHIDHCDPVIRRSDIKLCEKTGKMRVISTTEMCNPQNNTVENLKPACIACNIHKSSRTVEQFRKYLYDHMIMLNKSSNYSIYRHAKRFGLIEEVPKQIQFYFEGVQE